MNKLVRLIVFAIFVMLAFNLVNAGGYGTYYCTEMETYEGKHACNEVIEIDPTESFDWIYNYGYWCCVDFDTYLCWGAEVYFEGCSGTDNGCCYMYWVLHDTCLYG